MCRKGIISILRRLRSGYDGLLVGVKEGNVYIRNPGWLTFVVVVSWGWFSTQWMQTWFLTCNLSRIVGIS